MLVRRDREELSGWLLGCTSGVCSFPMLLFPSIVLSLYRYLRRSLFPFLLTAPSLLRSKHGPLFPSPFLPSPFLNFPRSLFPSLAPSRRSFLPSLALSYPTKLLTNLHLPRSFPVSPVLLQTHAASHFPILYRLLINSQ